MGKRKRDEPEYIRKKIRKLKKKLEEREESLALSTPPPTKDLPAEDERDPVEQQPSTVNIEEALPEEFLLALGHEGEDIEEQGEPITSELALRWTKIITEGLKKEQKEALLNKYPTPSNFQAAVAPIMNREIAASLSELSVNRDRRIIARQNMTGKIMSCLAKPLTEIMKFNINCHKLIEHINDAAKIAAEIYHTDTISRKFFALSSASKSVQDTCKEAIPGKFLFGDNIQEQLKAIETVKRTAQQLRPEKKPSQTTAKPVNWRGPPQQQPSQRGRGGLPQTRRPAMYQPPRRPPPTRRTPRHAPAPRQQRHHRRY